MWALFKTLFAQWALFKILLRGFGSLAFLVPLALLLKTSPAPLVEAAAWIERYRKVWEGNYQRLDALLGVLQAAGGGKSTAGAHGKRTTRTVTTKRKGGRGK